MRSLSLETGTEKVKILIISAAFPPMDAGEADHTFYLCRHLAGHGFDVHVLTTRQDIITDHVPFKVYPHVRNWSWLALPYLAMFLRRCSPDAVILLYTGWIYNGHPMITFFPTISKSLFPHVPFVTQFETAQGSTRCSLSTRVVRRGIKQWARPEQVDFSFGTLLRDSDRIIVLGEHHLALLSERLPGVWGKSVIVPPPPLIPVCPDDDGISRQLGRETLELKPDNFVIVYFGYVEKNKGVDTLLRAFQIVAKQRPNVRLIFVGGGNQRNNALQSERGKAIVKYNQKIAGLLQQLGIAEKVTWTQGYPSDSNQASIYLRAGDACVLPYDEGVSLDRSSFAAAAAHGLPIISTKGEILESPFIDRKNVFLCPPKDPETLAEAVNLIIGNAELRGRLRIGALELAQEWFSWDKAVSRTTEILRCAALKRQQASEPV